MYLLKRIIIFFLIGSVSLIFCKSKGPLTPEEALNSLKSAYLRSDPGKIESLLSERSKEKIRAMIRMISSMGEYQLKALAERFNTDADILRNLTIKEYLSLHLSLSKRIGDDTLKEIAKYKIIGVDINDNEAVVRIENGMEFFFLKEGPYWKFDMEELSSKD